MSWLHPDRRSVMASAPRGKSCINFILPITYGFCKFAWSPIVQSLLHPIVDLIFRPNRYMTSKAV